MASDPTEVQRAGNPPGQPAAQAQASDGKTLPDTAPAPPIAEMPDHFPEVHLDDETGEIRIVAPTNPQSVGAALAAVEAAPSVGTEPALVEGGATIRTVPVAQPSDPTVAVPPVTPTAAATPAAPRATSATSATSSALPVAPASAADAPHVLYSAPGGPTYQAERNVCIRCGSTNLARGYVVDFSNRFTHIHFAPKRMTPRRLNAITTLRPFRNLARLDAIACRDCGAVLLVAEPGEIRRAERKRTDY